MGTVYVAGLWTLGRLDSLIQVFESQTGAVKWCESQNKKMPWCNFAWIEVPYNPPAK